MARDPHLHLAALAAGTAFRTRLALTLQKIAPPHTPERAVQLRRAALWRALADDMDQLAGLPACNCERRG